MNGLYLVCDGGGTKTDFLLFEKTGRVRGRAQGAGANANFVPPAEAAHTVYAGVMECLAQAGAAPAQVREFVLFIPGFRPALPELETLLGSGNVRQLGDEKNAFYAALARPAASPCSAVQALLPPGGTKRDARPQRAAGARCSATKAADII